jgi:hypothetical protein
MLILFVSHGLLQFTLYKIMQAKYRSDMLEQIYRGIPDSYLTILKFAKSNIRMDSDNLQWTEDDEFRYENLMYDLIKTKVVGDTVYLYCIMDEDETRLNAYFEKYLQHSTKKDLDQLKDISSVNIFLSQLYSNSLNSDFDNHLHLTNQNYYYLTLSTLDGENLLQTPPPRS